MIRFFQQDTSFDLSGKLIVKRWIKSVITSYSRKVGEINVIFCSDPYILEMNNRYLGHNYYTDIITFDTAEDFEDEVVPSDKGKISGDLFISVDTVMANSREYEQEFDTELHRVIIHGVLHLLGEDDHTPEEIASMRAAENKALNELKSTV